MSNPIAAAAEATPPSNNSTGNGFATANQTPPAPAATPAPAAETSTPEKYSDGGQTDSSEKIQWIAIAIFAASIIAVSYKAIYYKRAIDLLGADNKKTTKKLQELEANLRAVRGEKYEPTT
jgi:hypothetical protein